MSSPTGEKLRGADNDRYVHVGKREYLSLSERSVKGMTGDSGHPFLLERLEEKKQDLQVAAGITTKSGRDSRS